MKIWTWALSAVIFLTITQCKSSEESSVENPITKVNLDTIPRYDSLNWKKEFDFNKINLYKTVKNYRRFDRYYHEIWEKTNVSGGFLVAQNGKILYENYSGYSDFGTQKKMDANTPIHIASISKVLTSLAILKLVENKKINLEDKLDKYFEGFPYQNVTIENLLSHRSGLPNYLHITDDKKYWDKTQLITNQDVLNILIEKQPPSLALPGRKFYYNNTNFVLLALVIEKVTKLTYPEAMKHIVFNPLGMKNTFVFEYNKHHDKVSKSYEYNGKEWAYDHLDATYGDKNIYSTPRDLYKMDVAMYSPKFLSKELKEKAWKGYSYESKGVKNYGLGFRMMEWPNQTKLLYHNGWWHGNNTVYVRDFQHQATIIALGNKRNRTIYGAFKLVREFGDYPFTSPLEKGKSGRGEESL